MRKVYSYILLLTFMFFLPKVVLADSFRYIEIDSGVSLTYTVDGETKTHNVNLCRSSGYGGGSTTTEYAANLVLYQVGANGTKTEISKSSSPCTGTNNHGGTNNTRKFRYERSWNNQFDTDNEYVLEYTIIAEDGSTFVYEKEVNYVSGANESFSERHGGYDYYGTVVKINDTISGDHVSPKLNITKNLEKIEKDGTFKFNIKSYDDENDTGNNYTITTNDLVGSISGIKLSPNKKYVITEVFDTEMSNEYKFVSFRKGEETITTNELVIETGDWNSDDIDIVAVNGPRVEHSKVIEDNEDGTYTLSLDVKGENVTGNANKANVIIVYDNSGSMNYYLEDSKGRWGSSNEKPPIIFGTTNTRVDLYYRDREQSGSSFSNYDNGIRYYYHVLTNDNYEGTVYYRTSNTSSTSYVYNGTRYREETRLDAANDALTNSSNTGLVDKLLAYNQVEGNDSDTVEVALVVFATPVNTRTFSNNTNWTTDKTIFAERVPTETASASSGLSGTNWEGAMIEAKNVADAHKDGDQTYVIFVTDGNPTNYGANGNSGTGQETDSNITSSYNAAVDNGRAIVNAKYILYTIGVYGDVTRMENFTTYSYNNDTTAADTYYFKAEDTAALNSAFDTILSAIERAGIGNVSILDGTTHSVSVSSGTDDTVNLLTIDEDTGFEYWMSFPIQDDGTIKFNEEVVEFTKTSTDSNGIEKYTLSYGEDSTVPNIVGYVDSETNTFHYKWESRNALYDVAPPVATITNGVVNWDLKDAGILLNNVTYSVKFNVWPSQYTYDLIASLKNGASYSNLPENVRKYLKEVNGDYVLYTNTTATVSYTDSRGNPGTITSEYKNPEPVGTGVSSIGVVKKWINLLDNTNESSVTLNVTRDGAKYGNSITLSDTGNPDTSWKGNVYISVGSISVQYNKIEGEEGEEDDIYIPVHARILEPGYDYSFAEDDYHWHLDVDTMHPMMINNHLTMLVRTDDKSVSDVGDANVLVDGDDTYYVINNKVYKVVTDVSNTFTVTNYRKSNINLIKKVDSVVPEHTLFEFSVHVKSPDTENDKNIYFSVQDYNNPNIPDEEREYITDIETTAEREVKTLIEGGGVTDIVIVPSADKKTISYKYNGTEFIVDYAKDPEVINGVLTYYYYTNYFYFPNNDTVTVKLEPGWNLRFTNLPIDTEYKFIEVLGTNSDFELDSSKVTATYYAIDDINHQNKLEENITDNGGLTIEGTVHTDNRNFIVTYVNKYLKKIIDVIKTWIDGDDENEVRPDDITVYLKNGEATVDSAVVTADTNGNWKHRFIVDRYDSNNHEIGYTVDEADIVIDGEDVPYYYRKEIPDGGFNIINRLVTNIPVTKTWVDNNNFDNHRPEAINVTLTGKVGNNVVKNTTEEITDDNWSTNNVWSYVFSDLDVYDDNNNKITYTISEDLGELSDDYLKKVDGYNITNVYRRTHTSIKVNKYWDPSYTKTLPEIVISLTSNPNDYSRTNIPLNANNVTVCPNNEYCWEYTFTDLPMYHFHDDTYDIITYTLSEVSIAGKNVVNNIVEIRDSDTHVLIGKWHVSVDGYAITNTWEEMPTISFVFKKVANVELDANRQIVGYDAKGGARFRLFIYVGDPSVSHNGLINYENESSYAGKWVVIGDVTSRDSDGLVAFNNLYEGEYRLVEIMAPEGYVLPRGQWRVNVTKVGDELQVSFGNDLLSDTPAVIINTNPSDTKYLIPNYEIPDIPSTGGIGIPNYKHNGLLLMVLSVLVLIINQILQNKKQENF